MESQKITRQFNMVKANGTTVLPDPNPDFTPAEVINYYSNQYPELTNSTISQPKIEGDVMEYELRTTVGTKG